MLYLPINGLESDLAGFVYFKRIFFSFLLQAIVLTLTTRLGLAILRRRKEIKAESDE